MMVKVFDIFGNELKYKTVDCLIETAEIGCFSQLKTPPYTITASGHIKDVKGRENELIPCSFLWKDILAKAKKIKDEGILDFNVTLQLSNKDWYKFLIKGHKSLAGALVPTDIKNGEMFDVSCHDGNNYMLQWNSDLITSIKEKDDALKMSKIQ
ncbi:hypothetical protein A3715_17040 [Oleiphilus sp. HI0009]|nr:hypothetical protein A3715_17040 [Oleiphilus sp. HI0009]